MVSTRGGLGVGISIVKHLVEAHGGRVTLEHSGVVAAYSSRTLEKGNTRRSARAPTASVAVCGVDPFWWTD